MTRLIERLPRSIAGGVSDKPYKFKLKLNLIGIEFQAGDGAADYVFLDLDQIGVRVGHSQN
jgi:hypothetical protein